MDRLSLPLGLTRLPSVTHLLLSSTAESTVSVHAAHTPGHVVWTSQTQTRARPRKPRQPTLGINAPVPFQLPRRAYPGLSGWMRFSYPVLPSSPPPSPPRAQWLRGGRRKRAEPASSPPIGLEEDSRLAGGGKGGLQRCVWQLCSGWAELNRRQLSGVSPA